MGNGTKIVLAVLAGVAVGVAGATAIGSARRNAELKEKSELVDRLLLAFPTIDVTRDVLMTLPIEQIRRLLSGRTV